MLSLSVIRPPSMLAPIAAPTVQTGSRQETLHPSEDTHRGSRTSELCFRVWVNRCVCDCFFREGLQMGWGIMDPVQEDWTQPPKGHCPKWFPYNVAPIMCHPLHPNSVSSRRTAVEPSVQEIDCKTSQGVSQHKRLNYI